MNNISVICAIVKNEHRFIREWVEHYISIGFDKLYVYEDYGSKSHEEQIKEFIEQEKVELVNLDSSNLPIPMRGSVEQGGKCTQITLYNWFLDKCKSGEIVADWIGFFDIDEFIMFEDGWNLHKFEDNFANYGGVLLSWKIYGANGHIKRPKGKVVESYTTPMPEGSRISDNVEFNVKSLCNVKLCGEQRNLHVFNGCVFTDGKAFGEGDMVFCKAWLNHYHSKSWEDYLERIFSRGNMHNNLRSLDTFFHTNPDMESKEKELIMSERYRHATSTMWISRKYNIISGGNVRELRKMNNSQRDGMP